MKQCRHSQMVFEWRYTDKVLDINFIRFLWVLTRQIDFVAPSNWIRWRNHFVATFIRCVTNVNTGFLHWLCDAQNAQTVTLNSEQLSYASSIQKAELLLMRPKIFFYFGSQFIWATSRVRKTENQQRIQTHLQRQLCWFACASRFYG